MIQDGTVRDAEIGTTGNASGDGQKRPHKSARSGDRRQEKNAGLRLELDSLKIEYQNLFDRSNKLDNKVYITITFCGFLFVFITGLFSKISQLPHVGSGLKGAVTVSYILTSGDPKGCGVGRTEREGGLRAPDRSLPGYGG